jgi:putative ABC transport system permease protein
VRHYSTVLLRTLQRDKLYAAINIAGLSLGVGCGLLLGLFLYSQLTYDRHYVLHDRLYRVVDEYTTGGTSVRVAITPRVLGPMLAADSPQIKAYVRLTRNSSNGTVAIHHGNDTYYWSDSYFASDNFFEVFNHKILFGDPKKALKDGSDVAVSATFARKYFGDANPVGQTIATDTGIPSRIALVFADVPANSHMKYDILFSDNVPFLRDSDNPTRRRQSLWGLNSDNFTYLLMAPGFDPKDWKRIDADFYRRYMEDGGKSANSHWHSWLQPLADVHYWSDVDNDRPTGNPAYLYACAAIALFIIAVACINYTNLATARATQRARGIGIRKVLGASRGTLALQFLGEGVLFALLAVILGVVIVEVVLRLTAINDLMGGQVDFNLREQPQILAWLLGLGLLMGLASGLYPALYLSSWAPLSALTGKHSASRMSLRLREGLVLLQFTISAAVIAATLLMAAQMRYISQKSLGFHKENRVVVHLRGVSTINMIPTIRTELGGDGHILGMSEAQIMPGQSPGVLGAQFETEAGALEIRQANFLPINEDFVRVMGLRLVQGRDYSRRLLTDVGTGFLVNETLVKRMGWTQPLGKRLSIGTQSGRVIGVVQDFNFRSLHALIEPLVMLPLIDDWSTQPVILQPFTTRELVIDITGSQTGQTLAHIEKVMSQVDPRHPFEYAFLDETLDNLYKSDRRLMQLIGIFAAVCIFIACLGLFGLAAFNTEQRTREIGTRKVLGATAWQIIVLLARRVLVLVLVAAVLASGIAYCAVSGWLSAFAYRAAINPLIFVLAAAAAAAVAFGTIALQSFKAASADPVLALRHVE